MLTRFSHQTTCRRRAGDERTLASAGRCLALSTTSWDTHRVAEQIDSEVRVIGP